MRRAGQKRTASLHTTSSTPSSAPRQQALAEPREFSATSIVEAPVEEDAPPRPGKFSDRNIADRDDVAESRRRIDITIRQRIESRLPGRVRNLCVRILGNKVLLEGQCATYYTKQLAQHAALGVLEDEQLENAIVVTVR